MSTVLLHTNHGMITLELDAANAPLTVANFIDYVEAGHYDGTIFHRVIESFMIQGGGYAPGMKEKPTLDPVTNEAQQSYQAGLKNTRGSISMARTNEPHSATAQFFINVADNDFLDYPGQDAWGYCVFGQVTEGMAVVDAIRQVKTGRRGFHQDVPLDDVLIERAEVLA